MKFSFGATRIRTRLLLVYVGVLFIGFAGLTLVAGQQISSAARADYEQRLQNEIRLIAQGIRPYVNAESTTTTDSELDALLADYEKQMGCTLTLFRPEPGDPDDPDDPGTPGEGQGHNYNRTAPEIETALRGEIVVMDRKDAYGQPTLYTAAPVLELSKRSVIVQLSVPLDNLQALVWQRWASLWVMFGLITGVALLAATLLAQSIIRPLDALRQTAIQLAKGDFSHRVNYHQPNEIGQVAQAFNEMARQVESMMEEQRAFASNTSHELRTPLTTIRLRSEALRYDEQLDSLSAKRYIEEIDDEVNRLGTLIEDLTLLSRFDAGRAELGNNQIDMRRFASGLEQRMLQPAQAKHITLTLQAPDEILSVCASLNHLTVVFRNLLDNAIKYTPAGGSIIWSITANAERIFSVIEDTGRGIETEQLPHLFERFYRGDKARSRDVPGTGLGLAIAKSIVDAYGGTISIESAGAGQGTIVKVSWPHAQANKT